MKRAPHLPAIKGAPPAKRPSLQPLQNHGRLNSFSLFSEKTPLPPIGEKYSKTPQNQPVEQKLDTALPVPSKFSTVIGTVLDDTPLIIQHKSREKLNMAQAFAKLSEARDNAPNMASRPAWPTGDSPDELNLASSFHDDDSFLRTPTPPGKEASLSIDSLNDNPLQRSLDGPS